MKLQKVTMELSIVEIKEQKIKKYGFCSVCGRYTNNSTNSCFCSPISAKLLEAKQKCMTTN